MAKMVGRIAAGAFVVLWATGFVGAKYGLPYAGPMTFLAIRFSIVAVAMGLFAAAFGGLRGVDLKGAAIIGLLIHGVYLGAVFTAISWGAGAAISALIVSMQPLVTIAFARALLGERLNRRQWLGIGLGMFGATLVVIRKLDGGDINVAGVVLCLFGLVAISLSSVMQKQRNVQQGLVADSAVQFAAAAAATGALALLFETQPIQWTPEFVFALAWMCIVLSLGAVTLLYYLIRRGAASQTASLFFLVPGVTALMAWAMFGEVFGPVELIGLLVAMVGVALASQKPKAP
ncbi:MAG: DMT family transporter [Pikeienuella sp.]